MSTKKQRPNPESKKQQSNFGNKEMAMMEQQQRHGDK